MIAGMKKSLYILIAAVYCLSVFPGRAETKPAAAPVSQAPGTHLAQQISLLTGIAISPLLGSSAYGCYLWYKAPEGQKANLPWFAQWWFWVPGLLIVAVCFIKDTAGNALPTVVKKPFDIIEAFENKISGLVATGAIVPFLMMITKDSGPPQAMLSSLGFAAADISWLYNIFIIPISMVAFFFVFLASNAINVLIILSPFTTVDAALKGVRLALLGTVAATAFANPWVGAAWALVIILFSYFVAGWSFRLSHYGTVYLWDFLTFRRNRFHPKPTQNRMFLGRRISKVPARTYGTLARNEKGGLVLKYRPWLFLAPREMVLPEGQYAVGKGLVNSEIMQIEGEKTKTALLLPPRFRGHEEEVVKVYGLEGIRPIGLSAAVKWLKDFFTSKEQPLVAQPSSR
jgi:hypothetical protein